MAPRRGNRKLGRYRYRSRPRTTLVWVAVVLVLLVVLDVVLVGAALRRTAPRTNGITGPTPTFSQAPSATPSPTPSASAFAGATTTAAHHLLSAVSGLEAWRASSGSCNGAQSVLKHSTDAGRSWQTVAIGDGVRTVSGMRATVVGLSVLVGVGDACTPEVRTTTDGGGTWHDGEDGAAGAGITADGLVLDGRTEQSPCANPLDALRGDRITVVICDGQLEWREGTGAWIDLPLGGVRAVAVDGDSYTVARIGIQSCGGVQIESISAGAVTGSTRTTPVGCDAVSTDGPIALDRAGAHVWVWAGDRVMVSADGGATW